MKYTNIIGIVTLGLAISSISYAQTPTLYQNREEIQNIKNQALQVAEQQREQFQNDIQSMKSGSSSPAELQERVKEFRADASSTRAEVRNQVQEKREEMVKNRKDIILKDFVRGIEVLENLYARIESRINKIKDSGIDVSSVMDLLKTASDKIALVKAEFEKLDALIPEEVQKAKASELFKQIREQSVVVRKSMREAHASMVDIINSLKKTLRTNATSTNQ